MSYSLRYTKKKSATSVSGYSVYAFVLTWPENNLLKLGSPVTSTSTEITMLGFSAPLKYTCTNSTTIVNMPYLAPNKMPCKDSWVLKFDNLKNSYMV